MALNTYNINYNIISEVELLKIRIKRSNVSLMFIITLFILICLR